MPSVKTFRPFDIEANGEIVGYMEPLDQLTDCTIRALRDWRNKTRQFFFYQGKATFQSTRAWALDMIQNPDKFLFQIHTPDHRWIGTYGYKRLSADTAELCNLIRGEPGGVKGFIYHAEVALLRHLFEQGFTRVVADIFADNENVLRLHWATGFKHHNTYLMAKFKNTWRAVETYELAQYPLLETRGCVTVLNTPRQFAEMVG